MAVKFEFYESPNTIGTRKKRYHARVVNRERIRINAFEEYKDKN